MMFFQLELATLIRVQNLSQTATDFRKKLHIQMIRFKYENKIRKKKNVKRDMPNI
jgi:hypothetical protein